MLGFDRSTWHSYLWRLPSFLFLTGDLSIVQKATGPACVELPSGGFSRAAGSAAIDADYVARGRLLLQGEKNIGQFEIPLLLAVGDGEGQVR